MSYLHALIMFTAEEPVHFLLELFGARLDRCSVAPTCTRDRQMFGKNVTKCIPHHDIRYLPDDMMSDVALVAAQLCNVLGKMSQIAFYTRYLPDDMCMSHWSQLSYVT